MSKEKFVFDLKMSMQLFYFNDVLYFIRDIEHLEKRANSIYSDLVNIINIDSLDLITIKNTCELDSNRYHIIFNICLYFANGESISVNKCFICDFESCYKL